MGPGGRATRSVEDSTNEDTVNRNTLANLSASSKLSSSRRLNHRSLPEPPGGRVEEGMGRVEILARCRKEKDKLYFRHHREQANRTQDAPPPQHHQTYLRAEPRAPPSVDGGSSHKQVAGAGLDNGQLPAITGALGPGRSAAAAVAARVDTAAAI